MQGMAEGPSRTVSKRVQSAECWGHFGLSGTPGGGVPHAVRIGVFPIPHLLGKCHHALVGAVLR